MNWWIIIIIELGGIRWIRCFVFIEKGLSSSNCLWEEFYTGNNHKGRSCLLQQRSCWAFIFRVCLLNTYRREKGSSSQLVICGQTVGSAILCAAVNLSLCWVPAKCAGRSLWSWGWLPTSKIRLPAATGRPYPLTSGQSLPSHKMPHLGQRTESRIPDLLLNFTWSLITDVFVSWLGFCYEDFLFVLLWKYFYLQRHFHWEMLCLQGSFPESRFKS